MPSPGTEGPANHFNTMTVSKYHYLLNITALGKRYQTLSTYL